MHRFPRSRDGGDFALRARLSPDSAEHHLLNALHLRAPGDRTETRAIYDLLMDPPLTGIERLRAIVEQDT